MNIIIEPSSFGPFNLIRQVTVIEGKQKTTYDWNAHLLARLPWSLASKLLNEVEFKWLERTLGTKVKTGFLGLADHGHTKEQIQSVTLFEDRETELQWDVSILCSACEGSGYQSYCQFITDDDDDSCEHCRGTGISELYPVITNRHGELIA